MEDDHFLNEASSSLAQEAQDASEARRLSLTLQANIARENYTAEEFTQFTDSILSVIMLDIPSPEEAISEQDQKRLTNSLLGMFEKIGEQMVRPLFCRKGRSYQLGIFIWRPLVLKEVELNIENEAA